MITDDAVHIPHGWIDGISRLCGAFARWPYKIL